jgi:hypothetical protein
MAEKIKKNEMERESCKKGRGKTEGNVRKKQRKKTKREGKKKENEE